MSRQQTAGETFFVVKDPLSGDFFRFREAEQFIAQQFDGETPLEAVRQRTEERFDTTLPAETLAAFVKNLEKTGLLETEDSRKKRAKSHQRIRGNLLYVRFKLFDPSHVFDRLGPRVQFCFTPLFLVLSSVLILLAAGTTIGNWTEITEDLSRLYRLASIPLFIVVVFVVVSAHEFAHGLTCKHFGGEVHEVGFLLIYFQPALYCNVSDAWLFPEKSKRLWVGFAGAYFELFTWALATLAWRLTDFETWINYLALIVMTSSGIKTFLNFNPLIKLDGYYLLSDYLEIPNLRRKSFRYVGGRIKRLFGFESQIAEPVLQRERRICFLYGVSAMSGSIALLGYVLMTLGGSLVEGSQSAAVVLVSTGFLGMKFRRRFRRLFGKSSDPSDDGDDFEASNTAGSVEPAAPSAEPTAPRRKRNRRWWRRIVWTVLIGAALAAVFLGHMELRIPGVFTVVPTENADVRAAVEGIIDRIYVDEGDHVKVGDVIARLSAKELRTSLDQTEAEMREARAKLTMLEAGPNPGDIEVAKAALFRAEAQFKYVESRLARSKTLFEGGVLPRNTFEDIREQAIASESDVTEAKVRLAAVLSSVRPEQIDATRAQIERLETQRQYLREQIRLLNVVSPAAGIVATPSRQLKQMIRQLVKKGDLIAKVYDSKSMTAQISISEKEIADIRVGQQVVLKSRALPDEALHGTVTYIATSAQGSPSASEQALSATSSSGAAGRANKTILVTTEIGNQSLLLKPEMTGQAKIFCGQRRLRDLIMRRLARTFKVEFWSWW